MGSFVTLQDGLKRYEKYALGVMAGGEVGVGYPLQRGGITSTARRVSVIWLGLYRWNIA